MKEKTFPPSIAQPDVKDKKQYDDFWQDFCWTEPEKKDQKEKK